MVKLGFFVIFAGILALPFRSVSAATNPIDDFCASSVAQADAEAHKQCDDLKSLQDANSKIKSEKDSI